MLADLHCHPATWSFQKLRNSPQDIEINPGSTDWHIWNISRTAKEERKIRKGKRANYAQSDFKLLSKGDVRLVFASMYPMEKGFFMGNRSKGLNADVVGGLLNNFLLNWPGWLRHTISFILKPLSRIMSSIFNNEGLIRDLLQNLVMKMHKRRIDFFQDPGYDYFRELEKEYAFYTRFSNQTPVGHEAPEILKYTIARKGSEIDQIIGNNQIAVVLTIEGFHSIALHSDQATRDFLSLVTENVIKERIKTLKEMGVFFLTFSHHFSNHLAGHAHSLPKLLMEIADPAPLMNEGFVNGEEGLPVQYGKKWIRELLSLSDQNVTDTSLGRRVLIDVKHMSAASRKEYYNTIIKPFNENNPGERIPVIASHCGYYGPGGETLDAVILKAGNELDDSFHFKGFYQWNINLCDEDIEVITESGGLIGISLDERILGVKPGMKSAETDDWAAVLTRNILGMVTAAKESGMSHPENIWKCLSIGSDYDGLIDPANAFPRAEELQHFGPALLKYLKDSLTDHLRNDFFLGGNPYTPEQVVPMICFSNARDFVFTHFK